jgi:hypothetical protein
MEPDYIYGLFSKVHKSSVMMEYTPMHHLGLEQKREIIDMVYII